MRTIKKIHRAENSPIGDLVTYRALPTHSIDYIDPFLFLNHHGPQVYPPHNNGLPFGPHPHRGIETVTFIIDGDIAHLDSSGENSVIKAGGVQWMTAGSGLIHAEISSDEFKKNGGPLEILQLWLNLPAQHKMTKPFYKGLQNDAISTISLDNNNIEIKPVSGLWEGQTAPFQNEIGVHLATIKLKLGAQYSITIPSDNNIFFYVINGTLKVNDTEVGALKLAEFNNDGDTLNIIADEDSLLLLGFGKPLNEPVVAHGPFVMNTQEEIAQAYQDYQRGLFGPSPM